MTAARSTRHTCAREGVGRCFHSGDVGRAALRSPPELEIGRLRIGSQWPATFGFERRRWVSGGEPVEFGERGVVLGAIGPLLGGDDVVERGDPDTQASELVVGAASDELARRNVGSRRVLGCRGGCPTVRRQSSMS